ncbi:MAG: RDD family protein [Hyphomonadaceae bacterium]
MATFPWARWAAKWIDLGVFSALLGAALVIFFQFDWYSDSAEAAFYLILAGAFPFWDGILVAMTGGSPGRAIFRFRIVSKDQAKPPPLGAALGRAWGAWIKGCGLGFPIVSLFTMLSSKDHLERRGLSSWDENSDTLVVHHGPRWWSWFLFFALLAVIVALRVVEYAEY